MKYILGAYATSPCLNKWDEAMESEYFLEIKKFKTIRGLEHPFWGTLHPFNDDWFLKNVDPDWDFVLTCIPGTMRQLDGNSNFGLASDDRESRRSAVNFIAKAREAVLKLNSFLGRRSVIAVQIHSAPKRQDGIYSSSESFVSSLLEIGSWDWQGAHLMVEHCDAKIKNHPPEKGFLSLDDEIRALKKINEKNGRSSMGIVINWGRSVLEGRSVLTPLEHIMKAKRAGLLRALLFSGCSNMKTPYGAWKDSHMPPPKEGNSTYYARFSLMTRYRIRKALILSTPETLDYVGIKIMDMPNNSGIKRRVGLNRDTLRLLNEEFENVIRKHAYRL